MTFLMSGACPGSSEPSGPMSGTWLIQSAPTPLGVIRPAATPLGTQATALLMARARWRAQGDAVGGWPDERLATHQRWGGGGL